MSLRAIWVGGFVFVALICGFSAVAVAQDVTTSVSGSVIDAHGAAVVDSTVKLVSDETHATFTETTNGEGNFIFSTVKPGFYSVTVEKTGFKKFEKSHIELLPGEKIS